MLTKNGDTFLGVAFDDNLIIEIGSDLATLSSERNYYFSFEIIGRRITVIIIILIMTIVISNNNMTIIII